MDSDWNGYSSDESGNSSDGNRTSGNISNSERNTWAGTLACDADGKLLCTCGCERRRPLPTVYRHLKNARLRRKLAKKRPASHSSNLSEAMDNSETHEDNTGLAGQMHEGEDEEPAGELNECT